MSNTLNRVTLIGYVGDEVKIHYFDAASCIGRFRLATHDVYTNKVTNEKVNTTEWHNIVLRNKAAEICEKYLGKGDLVYIEGRLKTRQWQTDEGVQRITTEIQVTEFNFLNVKKLQNLAQSKNNDTFDTDISEEKDPKDMPY